MAKPRKAARSIGVDWQGPLLRPFTDEEWAYLEKAFCVGFDEPTRGAIWKAVESYCEEVLLANAAEERAKLIGRKRGVKQHEATPLTKLERALSEAVSLWREADEDNVTARALIEVENAMRGEVDFLSLRNDLELTAQMIRLWLVQLAADLDESSTSPFSRMVVKLAEIMEVTGERVTSHGAVYVDGKNPSPFQEFMLLLNKLLPHPIPALSDEAFASRIARALS